MFLHYILNYNIKKHPLKNCIILLRNYLNNLLSHDMNYEIINFLDLNRASNETYKIWTRRT
mgnify:CR=1 FL=1